PVHVARVGIPGDCTVGVEIVARAIERVEHRNRIAATPDRLVGVGVVGAGHPHRAATSLPSVVGALPGFTAGLSRCRYRELAPQHPAGCGVEAGDPVANPAVATGRANNDLVLD